MKTYIKYFLGSILGISLSLTSSYASEQKIARPDKVTAEKVSVDASKKAADYGHVAPYLVVACSDFRLADEVTKFLEKRGLKDKYDKIVLPGASLGIENDKFPNWTQAFFEQFKILHSIHDIKHVIVIDHMDCGMFKSVIGESHTKTLEKEKKDHEDQLKKVSSLIHEKYPDLWVEGLLMAVDGQVSTVIEFHNKSKPW